VLINDAVCEGCGDCSAQSNCVSIRPKETPLGRKRAIDQSTCNDDLSCVQGFCPSFVIATGGSLRRPEREGQSTAEPSGAPIPAPLTTAQARYNVVVTGIGGTGVITIGAVLAMAAHIEGKSAATYNMTGLAQKNGPVYSHLHFADASDSISASRVDVADADLIIGCDLLTALTPEAVQTIRRGHTQAVVNSGIEPSAAFQLFPDSTLPGKAELQRFTQLLGDDRVSAVDATALANELTGDTIAANMLMVGYAFQKGLLPLQLESILRAVELNGVSVEFNRRALELGRRLAVEESRAPGQPRAASTLDALVQDRHARLIEYQDERYAQRYRDRVLAVREAEQKVLPGSETLCVAVARNYARLLAYKDEYEVARLYSSNEFRQQLERTFSGRPRLTLLLAPPTLFKPRDGAAPPRKRQFGPWIFTVLRVLGRLKGLRRTPFDPFGHTAERKLERQLIGDYERLLDELIARLSPGNHAAAVRLASVPEQVKGFGHVKLRNLARAKADEARWLQDYRNDAVVSEST
jgi:indolepyruvate ferredoxin oxidoreductase